MSSDSRTAEREEERRLNMRTLVIASSASAAAALLTSQLWIAGTWIAAAMTPVIVSLVSELLHRPTERIARSFTGDRGSLAAAGVGRPAGPGADPLSDRAPMEPSAGAGQARPPRDLGSEAPIRVYRAGEATPRSSRRTARARAAGEGAAGSGREAGAQGVGPGAGGQGPGGRGVDPGAGGQGPGGRGVGPSAGGQGPGGRGIGAGASDRGPGGRGPVLGAPGMPPAGRGPARRRRKIAFGAVFGTAALAFVIAVAALTLPELVAGESVGRNDGRTTLFGGKKSDDRSKQQAPQETTEDQQPTTPEEEQQPTTPEETTPAEEPAPAEETAPETAPAPSEPLQETTPVPPAPQP
jgi:hypothetical protein